MRKNTLLYLDRDLVEKAKKMNINISKLVEATLRQTLDISSPRTASKYLQRMLSEAGGENASLETYLLPFQIESLELNNVGPFKEFEAHFNKNALNVIVGLGGSGKSCIIRSILFAFGRQHKFFDPGKNGRITIGLYPDQHSVSVTTNIEGQSGETRGYRCLIMDDILCKVPNDMKAAFLEELEKLGVQTILSTSMPPPD